MELSAVCDRGISRSYLFNTIFNRGNRSGAFLFFVGYISSNTSLVDFKKDASTKKDVLHELTSSVLCVVACSMDIWIATQSQCCALYD